jgi:ABC-type phosphate transport system permease subunit
MRALEQKKGQIGLDVVRSTIVAFLVLAVLGIAIFLALSSLQDASLFTASSLGANNTDYVINNVTEATGDFFSNAGTVFSILVAVVIMLAIAIIVAVVNRFGRNQ